MHLNDLLTHAVRSGASDIHIKVGSFPMMRVDGTLVVANESRRLERDDTETMAATVLNVEQRKYFVAHQEIDAAYSIAGLGRFRCNVFTQRGTISLVIRVISTKVPTVETLELPEVLGRIAEEEPDLLLAWAVRGAARLIQYRDFSIPASSKAALNDWLYGADSVLAWLAECTETRPIVDDKPKVRTSYAHQQFRAWAEAAGFKRDTLPAINAFVQRIKANAAGIEYRRRSDGPVFLGMVVRHFTPPPPFR